MLQNRSTVNVTDQNFNLIIKKEIIMPTVGEKGLELEHEDTRVVQTITPALKQQPEFVNGTFKDIANKLINHEVRRNFMGKEKVSVKKAIDESEHIIINNKIEFVNECNSINSTIMKGIEEELEEMSENTEESHSEGEGFISEMDDSFGELINASEEDVNSFDIEEMFNNQKNKSFEGSRPGKTFETNLHLQKHVITHSNGSMEPVRRFECEICGNKFKKKHHLQRHILTHSQEKEFACADCEKRYKDKYDLQKHIASKHTFKECCGLVFENCMEFEKHEVIHKKSQRQSSLSSTCHICQKTYFSEAYLKRHLKIHDKKTPFVCNVCNKYFINNYFLKEHLRSHSGEKPFQCDKCDKTFSTKSNQVRHSRTHSRVRTCHNCTAEFEDEEEFQAHKKSCIVCYECGKCGLICVKSKNMKRHLKHSKCSSGDASDDLENLIVRII